MRQEGINHTLDNDGGNETLDSRRRNGLDACPTSSMFKQMLVSFSEIEQNEDGILCYVFISMTGAVFSDAPAGP